MGIGSTARIFGDGPHSCVVLLLGLVGRIHLQFIRHFDRSRGSLGILDLRPLAAVEQIVAQLLLGEQHLLGSVNHKVASQLELALAHLVSVNAREVAQPTPQHQRNLPHLEISKDLGDGLSAWEDIVHLQVGHQRHCIGRIVQAAGVGNNGIAHVIRGRHPLQLVRRLTAKPNADIPLVGQLELEGIGGPQEGGNARIEHVVVGIHMVLDERKGRVAKQGPQDVLRNIH